MKALSTIILLLSMATVHPAEAQSQGLPQLPLLPGRPAVRPLTRYLAAPYA